MKEAWKQISGYEGRYSISNMGRLRSDVKNIVYIIKPNTKGYISFGLFKDRKRKYMSLHALVLMAFKGPRPDGMHACHNDGNKVNNCLNNLRWATPKQNTADRYIHGTMAFGVRNGRSKLTYVDAEKIRKLYKRGNSLLLQKKFNVGARTVSNIINNKRWTK